MPLLYLVTLSSTLGSSAQYPEPFELCLLCGDRGGADLVLNTWFFLPLGLATGRWLGVRRAAILGLGLSATIEILQLWVPGRFSSFADILANGTGALLGAVVYDLLRKRAGATPGALAAPLAALFVGGAIIVGGWLVAPSPTQNTYWGQWTPDFGPGTRYHGEVLEATLNGHPFPSRRLPDSVGAPGFLLDDWILSGTVVKGSPPAAVASVLSIFDGAREEILYLGAFREHLVLRERLRAQDWSLDRPGLVSWNALESVPVGYTMQVAAKRSGTDRCLSVSSDEVCGLQFTPGRLWSLLLYPSSAPRWLQRAADFGWLAELFLPLGLLARNWRGALLSGALASGLIVLALTTTRLHLDPWLEPLGAAVGLVLGVGLAKGLERARAVMGEPGSDGTR